MSVHLQISNVALFTRVLQTVAVTKDALLTMFFTTDVIVLHVATDDQTCTAAATLPSSVVCSEYVATGEPRFIVQASALLDSLRMQEPSGPSSFGGAPHTNLKFTLSFPAGDGRLLTQIDDESSLHGRCIQSTLCTRPVRERLLDLRFGDAIVENVISIRYDAISEMLSDLVAFQCTQVRLEFTPTHLRLIGLQSPFGKSAAIAIGKTLDFMLRFETGNTSSRPLYRLPHIAAACGLGGLRSGSSASHRGGYQPDSMGGAGHSYNFAPWQPFDANQGQAFGNNTFDRTTIAVNAEKQLCVTHSVADNHAGGSVTVTIVISNLSELDTI